MSRDLSVVHVLGVLDSHKWGDPEYHEAHEILHRGLEKGLREWVKLNPPGRADYTRDTPGRAVYLYRDTLEVELGSDLMPKIDAILRGPHFEKLVARTISSMSSAGKNKEKDLVSSRYPRYRQLLSEIAEAKREWKADDARIKTTHAFRMMGGLARIGTRASVRYHDLVRDAQKIEREVLGKVLTE